MNYYRFIIGQLFIVQAMLSKSSIMSVVLAVLGILYILSAGISISLKGDK